MRESKPPRVSAADRAHFERAARAMRDLDDEVAPESLAEALRRMDEILERLGRWARPGIEGETEGDLYSHLAMRAGRP